VCTRAGAARGRVSRSTGRVPARGVGGGAAGGGSSSGTSETSCCRTAAVPARPLTITVSGERPARELAEWRSQGSELAEWRSQARELAESAAGCRTVKSGCRTVPAQAVHISTYWELWVSPERGCSPVEGTGLGLRLCIACLHVSQCSQCLCFSRRLLQRLSQGTVGGPGVVERWPTVHSNSAPKMGAARICGLRGHCWAPGPPRGAWIIPLQSEQGRAASRGPADGVGCLSLCLSVCLSACSNGPTGGERANSAQCTDAAGQQDDGAMDRGEECGSKLWWRQQRRRL
jgi:hypothetical protein